MSSQYFMLKLNCNKFFRFEPIKNMYQINISEPNVFILLKKNTIRSKQPKINTKVCKKIFKNILYLYYITF